MNIWELDDGVDVETVVRFCAQDRELLATDFFCLHPEFEDKCAALWLDELLDLCGVKVRDCPLSAGQLGLCDLSQNMIFINSKLDFVHKKTNLKALRASTLAHEFGHIRMHSGEEQGSIFVSYLHSNVQFYHPRSYQREREANLYAALFLAPLKELEAHKVSKNFLRYRQEKRDLSSSTIWKGVYRLAHDFCMTPTLMKVYLLELGWLEKTKDQWGKQELLKLRWGHPERSWLANL